MTEPDLPPESQHPLSTPPAAHEPHGVVGPLAASPLADPSGGPLEPGPSSLDPSFNPNAPAPLDAPAPPGPKRPSYLFLALLSTISVVADLGTKIWAEKTLVIGPAEVPAPKVLIKGVLTLFLAKNRGGAWGFLQHQPEKVRKPFFVMVSIVAILLLVGLYRRVHPQQKALKWGLPLVFGGAVGNLVDRIRYGHVIDFIDVQATWKGMAHHWPTFNVADIAICVGVGLMAVDMFTPRKLDPSDAFASPEAGDEATDPFAPEATDGSPAAEENKSLDEMQSSSAPSSL
jgi:signal peptidase II